MHHLDRLAHADVLADVHHAAVAHYGPGAALYVVDHEFGQLHAVIGDTSIELTGPLRRAMLRAESYTADGTTWTSLPERGDVIFVVAHEPGTGPSASERAVTGSVLGVHRRRLEDIERRRRRRDMAVAAEMQWDTLPLRADGSGWFDVACLLEPAYDVAGDVFDYAWVDDQLFVYSFDGMGHGLDATVSSVLVLAAVRNSRRHGGSLVDQMEAANEALFEQYGGDRFVTGAACRLDPDGSVSVVNAGHEPIRTISDGSVRRLDLLVDMPLGVEPTTGFRAQRAVDLAVADGLVLFSDGASSQSSDDGAFGSDRLDESLARHWSDAPLETVHDVVGDVLGFLGDDVDVDDDITAVVVRRRESAVGG